MEETLIVFVKSGDSHAKTARGSICLVELSKDTDYLRYQVFGPDTEKKLRKAIETHDNTDVKVNEEARTQLKYLQQMHLVQEMEKATFSDIFYYRLLEDIKPLSRRDALTRDLKCVSAKNKTDKELPTSITTSRLNVRIGRTIKFVEIGLKPLMSFNLCRPPEVAEFVVLSTKADMGLLTSLVHRLVLWYRKQTKYASASLELLDSRSEEAMQCLLDDFGLVCVDSGARQAPPPRAGRLVFPHLVPALFNEKMQSIVSKFQDDRSKEQKQESISPPSPPPDLHKVCRQQTAADRAHILMMQKRTDMDRQMIEELQVLCISIYIFGVLDFLLGQHRQIPHNFAAGVGET